METQRKQILKFLEKGNGLTPMTALTLFKCFRLSARIYELKREGHPIKTELVKRNKKHVARYTLEKKS